MEKQIIIVIKHKKNPEVIKKINKTVVLKIAETAISSVVSKFCEIAFFCWKIIALESLGRKKMIAKVKCESIFKEETCIRVEI